MLWTLTVTLPNVSYQSTQSAKKLMADRFRLSTMLSWPILMRAQQRCENSYFFFKYRNFVVLEGQQEKKKLSRIRYICRSQWPRGLRRRSAAASLLRSWVWIPKGAWMFVCCACYVLSSRGLCDELIPRPEESYRLRCVIVCDLETSWMRKP